MEKKETYSLREIILGSRADYLQNEELLKCLKRLTSCDDKQVKDLYFCVFKVIVDEKPELFCKFMQNPNTFQGFIKHLSEKLGKCSDNPFSGMCFKNNNGHYIIDDSDYYATVSKKGSKKFTQIADEILTSDFANKMDSLHYFQNAEGYYDMIYINPCQIYYQGDQLGTSVTLSYTGRTDDISILTDNYLTLNESAIRHILSSRIPAESLTEYHRQMIDESVSTGKPIEFSAETVDNNNIKLQITEKDNKVILAKVLSRS